MKIHFEIERNPDPPNNPVGSDMAFGIWEMSDETPEDDEIVATTGTIEEAERWIADHTPVTEEYLKLRGIGLP